MDDFIYDVGGTSRALREDAFDDLASLRSQLIILIRSSFLLIKLINIAKQDFNSMFHKIRCLLKKSHMHVYVNRIPLLEVLLSILHYHVVNDTWNWFYIESILQRYRLF